DARPALPPPPTADQRALRVLVVEDDPAALSATVEMIQLLGHWATGVTSAEGARDRFLEGAFDVVMTDVGLPALSGFDLVEMLRERHHVHVIFASGRAEPAKPIEGSVWLQKPFSIEDLTAALEAARVGLPAR
ncbi:MAG: response regulator, partial [Comamonadaceae bacterium]